MREIISLNYDWLYNEKFSPGHIQPNSNLSGFTPVTLPHTNKELPYNYFDEKDYQFVSCYRRVINIPGEYQGKCLFVDFEGVASYAKVWLNGELLGEHKGGYTPFSFEITHKVKFGQDNVLVVQVDSTERPDIPPFGYVIDYLSYGGIYRDVNLRVVDQVFVANVFAKPRQVLSEKKQVETLLFLENHSGQEQQIGVTITLKKDNQLVATTEQSIDLSAESSSQADLWLKDVTGIKLWDVDDPQLYQLEVSLINQGKRIDTYSTRIGFREAAFKSDGFYLNGKNLKIRGLNRHQAYPYVGYAMPARVQRKDADILKYELRLNTVRCSHYPQSKYFLDRCDEIGLLVLEEIPGWQHIGGKKWQEVACTNVREMIERDWNHPSIITWGVRINESPDDHDFYLETNRIARELDDTRQTSGIRCIPHSELLEDIYTMNDFSHSGGQLVLREQREITGIKTNVPYLVTECNGHMYPTKRFDQEERLQEHALRHLRVHNAAGIDPHMCGLISWCAFDYNTHFEFGSGDRICYHGVMDMFRIPKMAAHFYASQVSPQVQPVLEPTTIWARGERAIGGVIPLAVFTNCDYIEVKVENKLLGKFYPAKEQYPGVEYPPVIINESPAEFGEWGMSWFDGELIGYVNNQAVVNKKFVKNPIPVKLEANADDLTLEADGIDATRVVFKVVDQVGNIVPFINDYIKFTLEGPGEILGPQETGLIGGCIAVWVRTTRESGKIRLSATTSRLEAREEIKVKSN